MNSLYPLKFTPIIVDKIWGGRKLHTILKKNTSSDKAGESWEISGVKENVSVVSEGFLWGNNLQELIEIYMGDLVGDSVFEKFGYEFPLLIKFIDASEKLSIQVHPDDILAAARHGSFGKTEMWYVIQADVDAEITVGFNRQVSREDYLKHLNNKTLEDILNTEKTAEGDVFFLPSGRLHAVGAGILLAEIQQTSDITYRVYDYDRMDGSGKLRELHTGMALDAIDFSYYDNYKTVYQKKSDKRIELINCKYFQTSLFEIGKPVELDYFSKDSFVILICVDGQMKLDYQGGSVGLAKGETILIPAVIKNLNLTPLVKSLFLEVWMP
ncbi:MAG TPA: type I phosphomannose isomerase catalytic subunit [Bacteroidales bacterium]|nr:type I phosphomannose isomerase catalytic subunit [Bacteroidales bacterium]